MDKSSSSFIQEKLQQSRTANPMRVHVERSFRAPLDRVWAVWTEPDLIKQWWGPEGYTCDIAKCEFREGGNYLCNMKSPDGQEIWSGGTYKEIIPKEKIVCTDRFTDKDGKTVSAETYGMDGDWPQELTVTVEFRESGNGDTRLSLTHEGIPEKWHDDCAQGWNSSFNKFQRLVEQS